jgi:hypothetical protein
MLFQAIFHKACDLLRNFSPEKQYARDGGVGIGSESEERN